MTIKQQGGSLGRDPTFNDVDTTDLTVADTLNVNNGLLYADTANQRVGIGTTSPTFELHLARNGAGIFVQSTNSQEAEVRLDNTIRSWTQYVDNSGNYNFRDRTGAKTVLQFTTAGNLAVANGNGIDFSATSGTGTSELFDDYEEGTWTPVVSDASSGGNTASITVVGAKYIKIGKIVHLYARITNINTSGMTAGNILSIQGLPFTSGVDVFSCGSCVLDRIGAGGDTTINPRIDESSSVMQFSVTSSASGTQDSGMLVSAVGSTGSDIHSLQITYEAS